MDFDFEAFRNRKKWKHKDAAAILKLSMGYIGMMASNPEKKPSYETMLKLIDAGITLEELFGKERAEKLVNNSITNAVEPPSYSGLKAIVREVVDDAIRDLGK